MKEINQEDLLAQTSEHLLNIIKWSIKELKYRKQRQQNLRELATKLLQESQDAQELNEHYGVTE